MTPSGCGHVQSGPWDFSWAHEFCAPLHHYHHHQPLPQKLLLRIGPGPEGCSRKVEAPGRCSPDARVVGDKAQVHPAAREDGHRVTVRGGGGVEGAEVDCGIEGAGAAAQNLQACEEGYGKREAQACGADENKGMGCERGAKARNAVSRACRT